VLLERDWIEDIEGQKGSELADPRSPTLDLDSSKSALTSYCFSTISLYCFSTVLFCSVLTVFSFLPLQCQSSLGEK
jgi:hypothetical protein